MAILDKYNERMLRSFTKKTERVNALNLMDLDQDRKTINLSWKKTILNFKEVGDVWFFMSVGRGKETLLYFPKRESYIPLGVLPHKTESEIIERVKQHKREIFSLLEVDPNADNTGEMIPLNDGYELKLVEQIKGKTYTIEFLKDGKKYDTKENVFIMSDPVNSPVIKDIIKHKEHESRYMDHLAEIEKVEKEKKREALLKKAELRWLGQEALDYIDTIQPKMKTRVKKVLNKGVGSISNAEWISNKIKDGWIPKFEEWTEYSPKVKRSIQKAEWVFRKESEETYFSLNKTEATYALHLQEKGL